MKLKTDCAVGHALHSGRGDAVLIDPYSVANAARSQTCSLGTEWHLFGFVTISPTLSKRELQGDAMTTFRQSAKKSLILDALAKALDALVEKAVQVSDALAPRPQMRPVPVRARRGR